MTNRTVRVVRFVNGSLFALTVLGAAGTAMAQAVLPGVGMAENVSVNRPDLKVGDKWKVERRDSYNQLMSSEETIVTSVSSTDVELSINGRPGKMTPDLTLLEGPRFSNDPGYQTLKFPIEVGKKWSYKTKFVNKLTNATGTSQFDVEVKGMESVKVPAGEFQAYRLESSGYINPSSGPNPASGFGFSATSTYWYAPKAKAIVRTVGKIGTGGFVDDLIQLNLNP